MYILQSLMKTSCGLFSKLPVSQQVFKKNYEDFVITARQGCLFWDRAQ